MKTSHKGFIAPLLLALIVIMLIGGGVYVYQQNKQANQPTTAISTTQTPNSQTADWKTYTNTKYGYSLQYPNDWEVDSERQIIDETNKILSLVKIHDATDRHVAQIIVNQNEWMLKYSTSQVAKIIVNNTPQTAYVFPNGYECYGAEPGDDCSFFVIPILSNGVWYELHANGDAKTITQLYKDIFLTFKLNPLQTVTETEKQVTSQIITSITGPKLLSSWQKGTWDMVAPNASRFSVIWADSTPILLNEDSGIPYDNEFTTSPSFTHGFSKPGTYYVQFFAKNSGGIVSFQGFTVVVN
jgi:hypothetical protein